MLNVRFIMMPHEKDISVGKLVYEDSKASIYQIEEPAGRAWGVVDGSSANASCSKPIGSLDIHHQPVGSRDTLAVGPASVQLPIRVELREHTPNQEVFHVNASQSGLLIRSETWAEGWTVKVDSQSAKPVLRINCSLQGVWIDQGTHTVVFNYRPPGYRSGLLISSFASLLLVIWLCGKVYKYFFTHRQTHSLLTQA
jgi:hypothetical protein